MGGISGTFEELVHRLERRVGWHRLPLPLALLVLAELRKRLRRRNLFDTGLPAGLEPPAENGGGVPRHLEARTLDGTFNDLDQPLMGSAGVRFGRNVPLEETWPEEPPLLHTPNPRTVSRELLTRHELIPATTLNVLAAAWLQFEVHDWFSHGPNDLEDPYVVPLADDDPWPERPLLLHRTPRDGTCPVGSPQTWVNPDSHWWDGSQLYGRDRAYADRTRAWEDGKLRVDPDGMLPADLEEGQDLSDVFGAHWIGLAVLNTLFTLEHNAICDRLRAEHPTWSDDRLYDKARLVNAALMAKIHTVDWTPAVIAHPTTKIAMNGQWFGLAGEWVRRTFGRLGSSEVVSGIPGSPVDHHGVPYALTEEFVAVYRMHPLLPDDYVFRSVEDDRVLAEHTFPELNALHARARLAELTMPNAVYTLGTDHPGAITLHNYPRFLQDFDRPDGVHTDLAAVDVMRVRERGVPRYTRFRELFHMRPVRSFEELTPNPEWQAELRAVYGDVDAVDLMVGLYAETPPNGFGFSDTAFRVFILMASRRIKSDRFFTTDYTPRMYTQAGLEWVADNTMRTVLLRHFPQLAPALEGVANPFAPWTRVPARARSARPAAVRAS